MQTEKLLISAFEPFGGQVLNPSMALIEALTSITIPGVELHTIVLPVVRGSADERLLTAIDNLSPCSVLMFGEAGGRSMITAERVAINVDDYRIADNAGHQPRAESVVAGGPVGYFSTLPIHAMVAAMNGAGVPAALSDSAGTYLCNRVFYRAMHHIACSGRSIRAGFVHLPYLHEQVCNMADDTPSVSRDLLSQAAQQIIEVLRQPDTPSMMA